MRSEPNSPTAFYRRVGHTELRAIRRYPWLDALIAQIEATILAHGLSGAGPPSVMTVDWLAAVTSAIGQHCEECSPGLYTAEQLWFLALGYLEIRGTVMCWYELDDDDRSCLAWFFIEPEVVHGEDDVLGVRQHMFLALRERNMRVPGYFFSPSATA